MQIPSWEKFDFRLTLITGRRMTLLAKAVYEFLQYPIIDIIAKMKQHQQLINVADVDPNPPAWVVMVGDKMENGAAIQREMIVLDIDQICAAIDAATWFDIDVRIDLKIDIGNHPFMQPTALYANPSICIYELTEQSAVKLGGGRRMPPDDGKLYYTPNIDRKRVYVMSYSKFAAAALSGCTREFAWVFPFSSATAAKKHFSKLSKMLHPDVDLSRHLIGDFLAVGLYIPIGEWKAHYDRVTFGTIRHQSIDGIEVGEVVPRWEGLPPTLMKVYNYLAREQCADPEPFAWGARPFMAMFKQTPVASAERLSQIKSQRRSFYCEPMQAVFQ